MRSVLQSVWIVSFSVLCIAAVPSGTMAEDATSFRSPTGWNVGDANSTYQEWDVFTGASGNAPDIGHSPAQFAPTFSAASPAFVTGSHNLYSFNGDYGWSASIKNYGGAGAGTDVIVQIAATLNGDMGVYPDSVNIVKPDGSSIPGASLLQDATLFEGEVYTTMGWVTQQERLWEFYLPNYTDDFRVQGSSIVHSSLMQARVDSMISSVPEPGTTGLAGIGIIALGAYRIARRWRRSKSCSV